MTFAISTLSMAGVLIWRLSTVQVLALGCLAIVIGGWLKKKLPLLDRLCIPTPIVGGLVFSLVALALHNRFANFELDTTLRDLMMIAFMTTIGLNARLELIRRGGIQVLLMLGLATIGAVLQNLLGIGLARTMGVNPLVGILSGSVALAGGPATALAFGPTFEKLGVHGAAELGAASATFGIAVSGLIGGYIGSRLIRRNKLAARAGFQQVIRYGGPSAGDREQIPLKPERTSGAEEIEERSGAGSTSASVPASLQSTASLLSAVLVIGVAMGLGSLISIGLERMGLVLPAYIGAMIAAAIIRNVNDRLLLFRISQSSLDSCSVVSLYIFIVLAALTLRLWELAQLVLPMVIILAAQVALCWLMCVTACFYLMGRDYESAVMSSGFCGFMLGITANAMACMEELAEKFGPAPRSFLVVPVVGAFLIDFTNALIITVMANMVK